MAVLTGQEQICGAKSIQIAQLFQAVDSLRAGERVLLTGTVLYCQRCGTQAVGR